MVALRIVVLALFIAGLASAQDQSREPPLADPNRAGDPEENGVVRAQNLVPAGPVAPPGELPFDVTGNNPIVLAAGEQPYVPVTALATPMVTLDIEGSDVAALGQAVIYKLIVRNVGRAKAHNVVVRIKPPKNADKVKAEPPATADEAETRWELKALDAGASRTIEVAYKPKADADEIRLEGRVQFDFGRGMITKVAAPELRVKKEGPEKVVVGDTATYRITVTNPGKVAVRDIEVREYLNNGLVYEDREMSRGTVDGRLTSTTDPKSGERMWNLTALAPGQSKVLEYRVKAKQAGRVASEVFVKAVGVDKKSPFDVDVLTADLQLTAKGPEGEKGTVGQAAPYTINVENRGSAELRNVAVRCVFPPDMRPTKATNGGEPFRDTVQWVFKELKPGEKKELTLGLTTSTPGQRSVEFTARADKGAERKAEIRTVFAGVSAINWETDVPGTVSAGKPMTYRVTVSNTGTATARNTELRVDLPEIVDFVSTTPVSGKAVGIGSRQVLFQALDLPPGKKATYVIEVKARVAGEARVVFTLVGEGVGSTPLDHRKSTTITGTDSRAPDGPPPAQPDRTRDGGN